MNRRDLIKTLALGSGAIFIPQCFSINTSRQPLQIVVIGNMSTLFLNEFYDSDTAIHYTHISFNEDPLFKKRELHKNYKFEFDLISTQSELCTSDGTLHRLILDILDPSANYVFITNLIEPNIKLAHEIVSWVKTNNIDFRLYGTTPLFNGSCVKLIRFMKTDISTDKRIKIFDTNEYLQKLDGRQEFSICINQLEKALAEELYKLCMDF